MCVNDLWTALTEIPLTLKDAAVLLRAHRFHVGFEAAAVLAFKEKSQVKKKQLTVTKIVQAIASDDRTTFNKVTGLCFFVNYQSRSQGQASQKGNRSITIDLTTHVKQGFRHTPDDLYITFRQFALYNHLSLMFHSVCSMTHPGFVFTKTTNVHSTHTGITRSCIAAVLFFRTRHRVFYFLSKHE